jgi:pyruvate carboxylase
MHKNRLTPENILTEGKNLSWPDSVIDYFAGRIGQPDGGFPKALRELVLKGEKPLDLRPGAVLPSEDFNETARAVAEKYKVFNSERAIISYSMYPKVYGEYIEHRQLYHDVSRLPSHIFFHGMYKGEETEVEIDQGKNIIIKYLGMTEPNEKGVRTLSFELNGSGREVEVTDQSFGAKEKPKEKADRRNPRHVGAPIPGVIGRVYAEEGRSVAVNEPLFTIEAMKMETIILAAMSGVIEKIYAEKGDMVGQDELLATFYDTDAKS